MRQVAQPPYIRQVKRRANAAQMTTAKKFRHSIAIVPHRTKWISTTNQLNYPFPAFDFFILSTMSLILTLIPPATFR